MASYLVTAEFSGSKFQLEGLLGTHSFYQVPPYPSPGDGAQYKFLATVSRLQYNDLVKECHEKGISVHFQHLGMPPERRADVTVGKGDRFKGGAFFPQGLGSRPDGQTHDLGGIMNIDEIGSAMKGLVEEYGMLSFSTPFLTAEGAIGLGGLVGRPTADPKLYHLFFSATSHSNERG